MTAWAPRGGVQRLPGGARGDRRAGDPGLVLTLVGEQCMPVDIDALDQKINHLEQQVTDLRLQLEERDDDLAANRELMAPINVR